MAVTHAQDQCISCENRVPAHFTRVALNQCITCKAQEVSLLQRIKPDNIEREKKTTCILCYGDIASSLHNSLICLSCVAELSKFTGLDYEQLSGNLSKPWLIKSSGLVMGPLSHKEVEEKIISKEIGLFDYVQLPYGRWMYVREESLLKDAVEEARRRSGGKEDTVAVTTESTGVTEVGDLVDDTFVRAREVMDISKDLKGVLDSKSYSTTGRSASSAKSLLILLIMVLVGVGVFSLFNSKTPPIVMANYSELVERANSLKNAAQFPEAKKMYREALLQKEKDTEVALNLISLYLIDQQNVEADRTMNLFRDLPATHTDYVNFQMARGLRAVASGDTLLAEEEFKKGLAVDKKSYLSVVNLSAIYLMKGEPDRAYDTLTTQLSEDQFDPLSVIVLSEAAGRLYQKEKNKEVVANALPHLQEILEQDRELRQELLLTQTWLHIVSDNSEEALKSVDRFFEAEPNVSEKLLPYFLALSQRAQWPHLAGICQEIREALGEKARVVALLGVCKVKAGELSVGRDLLEDAHSRDSRDPIVTAALSWAYSHINENDKAIATLKTSGAKSKGQSQSDSHFFMVFQKWQLCLSQPTADCSRYERRLALLEPLPLEYSARILSRRMKTDSPVSIGEKLNLELKSAPRYVPFHEMKAELTRSTK